MVIVMANGARTRDVELVARAVRAAGGRASVSRGAGRTLVGVVGDLAPAVVEDLCAASGVQDVVAVGAGHPLVSREHEPRRSVVEVGGVPIGPGTMTVIAGPRAVETPEQTFAAARMAQRAGATLLRAGAYEPRTSPHAFRGPGERGLRILADVRRVTGLPVVTEVVGAGDVELVARYADMLQIGARNMQDSALLRAVGTAGLPVLLERGPTATIEEWLLAAEYVAESGNLSVVLCERGSRTCETATRNTLDISAVPVVQALSHLPVVVDPSHSGGRRELVLPLARAAVVAGADGLTVDVHPDPVNALCDGPQALVEEDLALLSDAVTELSRFMDRRVHRSRRIAAA